MITELPVMPRPFHPILAVLVALSCAVAGLAAADEPADGVLKETGLRKSGSTYVLAAEAEAQRKLDEARAAYRQMTAALGQQQAYDRGLREDQQAIRELTEQRIALNQQLAQAADVAQNNQLVALINGVTDRLNLLNQQRGDTGTKQQVDAQASRRREAYVQAVLDLRQFVDAATAAYAALAGDEAVVDALERVNRRTKARTALGPSRAFLANVALLEQAEASVLSESVDLRKEGGIFWLDVTFNGTLTRPMAFDTGAADVVLPAELAARIGLRPGKDDPVVRCRVADGSIVEARQMTVPSMRVGKFTVKDVPCTVMPADNRDVPPLLGQTFQRNFLLKFSPDSGKLVLSRVEATEAAGTPARAKAAARPSGRPPAGKGQARPGADAGLPSGKADGPGGRP
jgi:clan AA aspartic protease (TIGR02281 family)